MPTWGWVALVGVVAAGGLLWIGRMRVAGVLADVGGAIDPKTQAIRGEAEVTELEARLRRLVPNIGELSVSEGAALTPAAAYQICRVNRRAVGADVAACEELLSTGPVV